MLRAALTAFVLASLTGAVACGSSASSGPAVVAGAPAGDVTEVSGTVTATRAGTPRPLAVGDVISGDDVIDTGADGRVSITLRHNHVAWTLGPAKKEQVGGSLAWRAPSATQTAAGPTGERSGAAGRHAERSAAETGATGNIEADMGSEPPPAPAMAAAPMAPGAPADPMPAAGGAAGASGAAGGAGAGTDLPDPAAVAAAQDEMARAQVAQEREVMERRILEAQAESARGAKMEATRDDKGTTRSAKIAVPVDDRPIDPLGGKVGGGGGRLGTARGPSVTATVTTTVTAGPLAVEVVRRIVMVNKGALFACLDAPGVVASAKLTIGTDGKVSAATVAGVTKKVADCQTAVFRRLRFPAHAGGATTAQVRLDALDIE